MVHTVIHPPVAFSAAQQPSTDTLLARAFIGPIRWFIPPIEDRTEYKKKSGSSDAYNTYDAIET